MNFYNLNNSSFLTFITESNSRIRGLDIKIDDEQFFELVHQGIFSILCHCKEKEDENKASCPYYVAEDGEAKYKEEENYDVINSVNLKSNFWPHYPVILGITFKNEELKDKVMAYAKENY